MSNNPGIDNIPPNTGRIVKENDQVINAAELIYVDPDDDYQIPVMDVLHIAVHRKKMHTVSNRLAVAQNGFNRLLIEAGTKDVHIRIAYSSEDFAFFNTYGDVTNIAGKVAQPVFNRMVGEPSNVECVVSKGITSFTNTGARGQDFVGAGGAVSVRAGGTGSSDIETVIKAGHNLLLELQRTETGTKHTGFICNLYERSPI